MKWLASSRSLLKSISPSNRCSPFIDATTECLYPEPAASGLPSSSRSCSLGNAARDWSVCSRSSRRLPWRPTLQRAGHSASGDVSPKRLFDAYNRCRAGLHWRKLSDDSMFLFTLSSTSNGSAARGSASSRSALCDSDSEVRLGAALSACTRHRAGKKESAGCGSRSHQRARARAAH